MHLLSSYSRDHLIQSATTEYHLCCYTGCFQTRFVSSCTAFSCDSPATEIRRVSQQQKAKKVSGFAFSIRRTESKTMGYTQHPLVLNSLQSLHPLCTE